MKEVVAELTLENRLLKKSMIGGWGGRRMRYSGIAKSWRLSGSSGTRPLPVRTHPGETRHSQGDFLSLV